MTFANDSMRSAMPVGVRKLLDGSVVPELAVEVALPLHSRCPQKWLSVDMETGSAWVRTPDGWKAAGENEMTLLKSIVAKA